MINSDVLPTPGGSGAPLRIAFLLIPQFSMMAFSAAIEPLRSANRMSERHLFDWRLVSVDGGEVAASNGIGIAAHESLAKLRKTDMLIVCAGLEPAQFGRSHGMHRHLRRLARSGSMIGAISSGSFILADAGLLAGRRCTVHWEYADLFRARHPTLEVSRELYVVDRGVFTCSGGTAALDMMLHFVSEASAPGVAVAVAEQFIHPQIRRREDHQRLEPNPSRSIGSPKLKEIIRLMEGTTAKPPDMRQLADCVGLSARQVERLFREHLRTSPKAFYLNLRLSRARALLRQTINPVIGIALECGFGSTSHFYHAYKREFGVSPTQDRRRSGTSGSSGKTKPRASIAARDSRQRTGDPVRRLASIT
ncbi:MAG: GlxA family transcriptional regulator [Steroidobacteraceae bacterium]|jgi:transcriptional regulator GlxA family with amidase domain